LYGLVNLDDIPLVFEMENVSEKGAVKRKIIIDTMPLGNPRRSKCQW